MSQYLRVTLEKSRKYFYSPQLGPEIDDSKFKKIKTVAVFSGLGDYAAWAIYVGDITVLHHHDFSMDFIKSDDKRFTSES